MPAKRPRLFYLDLIRTVALISILIIHFNASVTGYFTYPSRLFGSILPFGIYLGDFGSSLFFMVSGTALTFTTKEPFSAMAFYKKRAKAVYPMFWLAWCIFFSLRFVTRPWYYASAKPVTLILTVLGLDNYAVAAGWVSQDFACVGEWFLGSILFLYLLFPLLRAGLKHHPVLTWAAAAAVCLPVHAAGWDAHLLAVHLLEFLFGMTFLRFGKRAKILTAAVCAVFLLSPLWKLDSKITCAMASALVFVVLAWLGGRIHCLPLQNFCALAGKYSYAIFLTHHVIILRLVEAFDLSAITRRDTVLLFGAYLFLVGLISALLFRLDKAVRSGTAALFAKS